MNEGPGHIPMHKIHPIQELPPRLVWPFRSFNKFLLLCVGIREDREIGWDFIQVGDKIYKDMDRLTAFEIAHNTWAEWVDSNIYPTETSLLLRDFSISLQVILINGQFPGPRLDVVTDEWGSSN